jgi:uncharacterized membrane protein
MRRFAALLISSFLQGLLLLSPIAITAVVLYTAFTHIDSILPGMKPGVGFAIVIAVITVTGYLGTRFFIGKWLFDAFNYLMERTPGVKYIYTSVRDMIGSFVGDKKRFNKPVWVCMNHSPEIWRLGFMTQQDLASLGMHGKASVYLPHAYAISGWVIVTDIKNVKPVTRMNAAEAMKFAVSGGVTSAEENKKTDAKETQF